MRSIQALLAGVGLALACGPAYGTVLTFDWGGVNSEPVPPYYGYRVGSPSFTQPAGWSYGADFGPTPHSGVIYSPVLRLGGALNPPDPVHTYGDLVNVLYRDRQGGFEEGIMQITIWSDPGYQISLYHFDLAAVYNAVANVGDDLPAKSIKVLDGSGSVLYALNYNPLLTNPDDPNSTFIPGTLPLRHKRISFDNNPLTANTIVIRIDLNQLQTVGGSKIDRFAIDNIAFGEGLQLPAPGGAAVLGLAGVLAARRRRR